LSDTEVAKFSAQRYRFPGVEVKARLFRQYPMGHVASHAIGYIGRITERDLKWIEEAEKLPNYKGTDHIGKTGLEQHYEFELHGETGYEQVEIDAGGRAAQPQAHPAGFRQQPAADAGHQAAGNHRKAFGDRKGALVAIDPSTGGVLALVSTPTYDPNLFVDGITPENWKELNEHPDKPMINRTINGAYPPGSTFKPFMALAALEMGKRTQQAISDPGYFFGNHTFRDDKKGGHGVVDMYKSIVHSCDTYYYVLANDMGIDNIAKFMGSIGFGQRTGIDLGKDDAGESKACCPRRNGRSSASRSRSSKNGTPASHLHRHRPGLQRLHPIQLAQATATLANNGVMFRPHLVQNIVDTKNGEKRPVEPKPLRDLGWKQKNLDVIHRAMIGVNKEGTGTRAFAGAPYSVGGKTGTAQVFS
jgi:penicillin-binding protein 2